MYTYVHDVYLYTFDVRLRRLIGYMWKCEIHMCAKVRRNEVTARISPTSDAFFFSLSSDVCRYMYELALINSRSLKPDVLIYYPFFLYTESFSFRYIDTDREERRLIKCCYLCDVYSIIIAFFEVWCIYNESLRIQRDSAECALINMYRDIFYTRSIYGII